ncbi:TOBE domain-containing protein [Pseudomonas mangiferae]|uniref:LysR family transcriptional regulator n=1 Tax=Pseudomonas mangiferae TaxID=2593654 RepID=A0A553H047_9PSED|nr:TOBE domain-containing protein [Pseudomonas mangiferae]TRX75119.1 LysR family transcriptional regulator [Pseudomonas mangiferae]
MSLPDALAHQLLRQPRRFALLERIAADGSISRAARAVGLSYKAAWDAVDALNNLADRPLVARSVGGRGGGGAQLTEEGQRVLALYQRLERARALLLGGEDDLQLLGRLLLRTSARNQLSGRVLVIETEGHNDRVTLALNGGERIQAQITHASTEALELREGVAAVALIKAGWLDVQAPSAPVAPGDNRLDGQVEQVLPADEGPAEVRILLPGGQVLCALATAERLQTLALAPGSPVSVRVAASQVLLGTAL